MLWNSMCMQHSTHFKLASVTSHYRSNVILRWSWNSIRSLCSRCLVSSSECLAQCSICKSLWRRRFHVRLVCSWHSFQLFETLVRSSLNCDILGIYAILSLSWVTSLTSTNDIALFISVWCALLSISG